MGNNALYTLSIAIKALFAIIDRKTMYDTLIKTIVLIKVIQQQDNLFFVN